MVVFKPGFTVITVSTLWDRTSEQPLSLCPRVSWLQYTFHSSLTISCRQPDPPKGSTQTFLDVRISKEDTRLLRNG